MAKRDKLDAVDEAMRDADYTTEQMIAIINATNNKICAYPELTYGFGASTALFLTQLEWRWNLNGKKSFYKYIDECDSCRLGDSWAFETGLTRNNVETAMKQLGTRVRGPKRAEELLRTGTERTHIVVYYKPKSGALQWYFNERLFLRLRTGLISQRGIPFPEFPEMAVLGKTGNGRFEENVNSSSELTQNLPDIEEKNVTAWLNDDTEGNTEVDEVKRAEIKKKNNKSSSRTLTQIKIIENASRAKTMPLDFSVSPSTIARAVEELGEEKEWVEFEAKKFRTNYTNKNPTKAVVDWNGLFIDEWVLKAIEYRGLNELKYAKAGTRKSAGAERLERLEELATTDIFGDTSFEDLGRSLLEERYGSDESSIDS